VLLCVVIGGFSIPHSFVFDLDFFQTLSDTVVEGLTLPVARQLCS
jgi:hypothetical protein